MNHPALALRVMNHALVPVPRTKDDWQSPSTMQYVRIRSSYGDGQAKGTKIITLYNYFSKQADTVTDE